METPHVIHREWEREEEEQELICCRRSWKLHLQRSPAAGTKTEIQNGDREPESLKVVSYSQRWRSTQPAAPGTRGGAPALEP